MRPGSAIDPGSQAATTSAYSRCAAPDIAQRKSREQEGADTVRQRRRPVLESSMGRRRPAASAARGSAYGTAMGASLTAALRLTVIRGGMTHLVVADPTVPHAEVRRAFPWWPAISLAVRVPTSCRLNRESIRSRRARHDDAMVGGVPAPLLHRFPRLTKLQQLRWPRYRHPGPTLGVRTRRWTATNLLATPHAPWSLGRTLDSRCRSIAPAIWRIRLAVAAHARSQLPDRLRRLPRGRVGNAARRSSRDRHRAKPQPRRDDRSVTPRRKVPGRRPAPASRTQD
jgi:hypothetical protein